MDLLLVPEEVFKENKYLISRSDGVCLSFFSCSLCFYVFPPAPRFPRPFLYLLALIATRAWNSEVVSSKAMDKSL
jgi:hypothetical protein